jgi:hypothetical protein
VSTRATPQRTCEFSPTSIEGIAARACSLHGLPESQYTLMTADERYKLERGTYNVIAALESLGYRILPPVDEHAPLVRLVRE